MTTETIIINDTEYIQITADPGKTFRRIHDGHIIGSPVILSVDYSTGQAREDKPEYYEEVERPESEFPEIPTESEKDEALKILGVQL